MEWIGPREGGCGQGRRSGGQDRREHAQGAVGQCRGVPYPFGRSSYIKRRKALYDRKIISKEELDTAPNRTGREYGQPPSGPGAVRAWFLSVLPSMGWSIICISRLASIVGRGGPIADLVNVEKVKIEVSAPELGRSVFKIGRYGLVHRGRRFPIGISAVFIDFVSLKADSATKDVFGAGIGGKYQ